MAIAPLRRDTLPFHDGPLHAVAITELLDRIPFSPPRPQRERPEASEPPRAFDLELPTVERVGPDEPEVPSVDPYDLDEGASMAAEPAPEPDAEPAEGPSEPTSWSVRALPSWAAAVIGGLSLLSLALAVTLAAVLLEDAPVEAVPVAEPDAGLEAPPAEAAEADVAETSDEAPLEPATAPSSFAAEPSPIPVELLTRLEEASDQPLEVELTRLLDATQHGFGRRSARLEPTLRSYVYRMASRFEWNPATFRVAVTAPDPDLAAARGALLEQLFAEAVEAGRLDIGTGVGPHGLTLVGPPADPASTNPE